MSSKIADQVSHRRWPKDGSFQINRAAEPVAFTVRAEQVHIDADNEILEVEGKIAALEAQSANVHDESNSQKVGTKGAASVPEESSGSQSMQLGSEWQKRCLKVRAFEKENEEVGSDR